MPIKVNQICNLELPNNRLSKYHRTRYYFVFQGISWQIEAKLAKSYNYGTMGRYYS